MKQLAALFLAISFFPAGCQKIDGSANQVVKAQNADQPSIIKTCLQKSDSPATQIDLRRVPHIVRAEFISPNKIWLATLFKEIYFSEDAGKTWKKLRLQNAEYFETFNFLNEQTGWLADSGKNIWKTTDGGKNWNRIYSFKTPKQQGILDVREIKFTSAEKGWLRETSNVFRTADGGRSWEKIDRLTEQPQEMFFNGDAHGWIGFGKSSQKSPLWILRTADGGQTWSKDKIQTGNSIEAIYFLDERNGWLGNADYELFVTKDAGENWSKTNLNVENFLVKAMFWLNPAQGWLAGAIVDPNKPVSSVASSIPTVLSTTDGGQSWNKFQMPTDEKFFSGIYFADAANGWLTSKDAIYKTIDGGKNWKAMVKIDLSCPQ